MNRRSHPYCSAALLVTLLVSPAAAQTAPAQPTPTQTAPVDLAKFATGKYVILEPQVQGNVTILNEQERGEVLGAMKRDSAGALKRRYPGATIVTDSAQAAQPDVIRVTPMIVAPPNLLPWSKLSAGLSFDLAGGQRVVLSDQYSIMAVWAHRFDAANFVYDGLLKKLP
ncbi:hypothetical protein [Deinococcus hopiensis]|uniref:DUF302 domain-containing protein n=1 Tax=Deinococcus hopiensis KR-140 TaxID=695939 RepID=A0A1W1VFV2_9DEIO|nr:hypothetical protein [Deinococcus hopiensis]SMB92232.1 hypothetical protein SAMN00790413_01490 [Deinococcus hopiensis KR-140]